MNALLKLHGERLRMLARFFLAGSIGTGVHFGILAFLVERNHASIILATTIAFICAWSVSFVLQKYWTFNNASREQIWRQIITYVATASLNVGVNAALMHVFAVQLSLHYLIAQTITTAIIGAESFIIYRLVVFKETL